MYGTKIMVPLYIQRLTMKFVTLIDPSLNKYKINKSAQLDLLVEKILQVIEHTKTYQKIVAKHYAKSIIK